MAEAFRLERACKALGGSLNSVRDALPPSTALPSPGSLRLRSLRQAQGKQGKRGEHPASPSGAHKPRPATTSGVHKPRPASPSGMPKPHPVKPSGMHSPLRLRSGQAGRAPRNPIRDAQTALHNSCYRNGGGTAARSARFFSLEERAFEKIGAAGSVRRGGGCWALRTRCKPRCASNTVPLVIMHFTQNCAQTTRLAARACKRLHLV